MAVDGVEQKAGGSVCKSPGHFSEGLCSLHPEGGLGLAHLKEQVFLSILATFPDRESKPPSGVILF